jgi:hypothetical protein
MRASTLPKHSPSMRSSAVRILIAMASVSIAVACAKKKHADPSIVEKVGSDAFRSSEKKSLRSSEALVWDYAKFMPEFSDGVRNAKTEGEKLGVLMNWIDQGGLIVGTTSKGDLFSVLGRDAVVVSAHQVVRAFQEGVSVLGNGTTSRIRWMEETEGPPLSKVPKLQWVLDVQFDDAGVVSDWSLRCIDR